VLRIRHPICHSASIGTDVAAADECSGCAYYQGGYYVDWITGGGEIVATNASLSKVESVGNQGRAGDSSGFRLSAGALGCPARLLPSFLREKIHHLSGEFLDKRLYLWYTVVC
jgi:hypothetical protein